ncbi:hypothetical protein [Deinococcus arenicola]|uniref:M-like protein n=1 Tax=Deinococcus arenicola TaxID=2994950 RepID=A0ABU4DT69_9DEIO|nr:hypothetical protein [Deinococcus sp. ZS9-10]MDV6375646.1 hypothetical protein [Deinococcus sp. ZS9-10]
MTDNRYGDQPLGKSVEEVEREEGNRVNSSVPGELQRDAEMHAAIIPAVVGGGTGGSVGFPAVLDPDGLIEDGSGADDGTAASERGSSGWAAGDGVNQPMADSDRGTSES